MDLVSAFNPSLAVKVENFGKRQSFEKEILEICQRALWEEFRILVDRENKVIYISGKS